MSENKNNDLNSITDLLILLPFWLSIPWHRWFLNGHCITQVKRYRRSLISLLEIGSVHVFTLKYWTMLFVQVGGGRKKRVKIHIFDISAISGPILSKLRMHDADP